MIKRHPRVFLSQCLTIGLTTILGPRAGKEAVVVEASAEVVAVAILELTIVAKMAVEVAVGVILVLMAEEVVVGVILEAEVLVAVIPEAVVEVVVGVILEVEVEAIVAVILGAEVEVEVEVAVILGVEVVVIVILEVEAVFLGTGRNTIMAALRSPDVAMEAAAASKAAPAEGMAGSMRITIGASDRIILVALHDLIIPVALIMTRICMMIVS